MSADIAKCARGQEQSHQVEKHGPKPNGAWAYLRGLARFLMDGLQVAVSW